MCETLRPLLSLRNWFYPNEVKLFIYRGQTLRGSIVITIRRRGFRHYEASYVLDGNAHKESFWMCRCMSRICRLSPRLGSNIPKRTVGLIGINSISRCIWMHSSHKCVVHGGGPIHRSKGWRLCSICIVLSGRNCNQNLRNI